MECLRNNPIPYPPRFSYATVLIEVIVVVVVVVLVGNLGRRAVCAVDNVLTVNHGCLLDRAVEGGIPVHHSLLVLVDHHHHLVAVVVAVGVAVFDGHYHQTPMA